MSCRTEIEILEQAVTKEREKYQHSTQALSSGLSAIPVMAINDSVIAIDIISPYLVVILLSLFYLRSHFVLMMRHTFFRLSYPVLSKTF